MKRLARWAVILVVGFALAIILSRTASVAAGSHPSNAVAALAANSQLGPNGWCWRGLCPLETPFDYAVTAMKADTTGFYSEVRELNSGACCLWFSRFDIGLSGNLYARDLKAGTVVGVVVVDMPYRRIDFRLGDAMKLFGKPSTVFLCEPGYLPPASGAVTAYVEFSGGVSVTVEGYSQLPTLNPDMLVNKIAFEGPVSANGFTNLEAWKHFARYRPHSCGD